MESARSTIVIRALYEDDKALRLRSVRDHLTESRDLPVGAWIVGPNTIREIPTSPFAYWAGKHVRALFGTLDPFASGGRVVKQGIATADDFRFVRNWIEVGSARLLSGSQSASREALKTQLDGDCAWAPVAKGGARSPFYRDLIAVLNWHGQGAEVKARVNPKSGQPYSNVWQLAGTEDQYFFTPGATWPLRGISMSAQAVPRGAVFSVAGKYATCADLPNLGGLLALMNSSTFDYLIRLFAGKIGGVQYEAGLIGRLPHPGVRSDGLTGMGLAGAACAARNDTAVDTSHLFHLPALLPD